jgi:hypothetical protein
MMGNVMYGYIKIIVHFILIQKQGEKGVLRYQEMKL